jgi:hypothetical protein
MRKWICIFIVAAAAIFTLIAWHRGDDAEFRFMEFKANRVGDVFAIFEGRLPSTREVKIRSINRQGAACWEPVPNPSFGVYSDAPNRVALGMLPLTGERMQIVWSVQRKRPADWVADWRAAMNDRKGEYFSGALRLMTNEVSSPAPSRRGTIAPSLIAL